MSATEISWTEAVWNPATGCDKVSPGCGLPRFEGDDIGGCYAMAMAKRLKGMGQAKYQNDGDPRTSGPGFGVTMHPDALSVPLRWRKSKRIFVNSMSDLFHEKISDEFIGSVFEVMAKTPRHTYQILTKRHARMRSLLTKWGEQGAGESWAGPGTAVFRRHDLMWVGPIPWPLPNVHLGVSAEDQKWANLRIPALLDTPAAVRWVSAEPLLGGIDLNDVAGIDSIRQDWMGGPTGGTGGRHPLLDWVVAGGESGPNARPVNADWLRLLRDQCQDADVPFHFKQWGGRTPKAGGRELDGQVHDAYPAAVR